MVVMGGGGGGVMAGVMGHLGGGGKRGRVLGGGLPRVTKPKGL